MGKIGVELKRLLHLLDPVAGPNTGQLWYLQNKVRQAIAKDVFDNINMMSRNSHRLAPLRTQASEQKVEEAPTTL